MASIGPALRQLVLDPEVGPRATRIYVFLTEYLDVMEYRAVKLLTVARSLRIRRAHVSAGLGHLVRLGYLDRGGRAWPGGPFSYRLIHSVRPPEASEGKQ